MATLRIGRPYWLERGGRPRRLHPPLRVNIDVDVAIVGGGITGCTAAYVLARSGASVALLEADEIGHGSTAASTALLMQEPDTDFSEMASRYGAAAARHVWRAGRAAVTDLRHTMEALHIDASTHGLPSIYVTRNAGELPALRREHRRRRQAGLPARWLGPDAIRRHAGIDAEGAIMTAGNAQVDPFRACLGLAGAAAAAGAHLFERSPVSGVRRSGLGVELTARGRRVRAAWVVVATGYATREFKPLASRFEMVNTYVIATPPLSPGERASVGLGDVMLWDTDDPYHYLRWTPDHRLLFGGGDRPVRPGRRRPAALAERTRALVRDLSGFYPSLAHVEPAFAWEGLFATTPDGLPYVGTHRRYPRHLFALGYGGNGMTFSFIAARMLARIIDGTARPEDAIFSFGRGRG